MAIILIRIILLYFVSFSRAKKLSDNISTSSTCSKVYSGMQILIISPIANESFMRGETIKLKAAVISNQHTTKSHLVWDSDKDGRLGSGSSLLLNHLSVGLHRITVSGYSLKVSIQITIFQDLWALYQSPLSLASINSTDRDFTLNWIDGSASDEKWKLYQPPKFDQKLTDPSKLVLFAKLRVLKHQRFDEPLPHGGRTTVTASYCKMTSFYRSSLPYKLRRGNENPLSAHFRRVLPLPLRSPQVELSISGTEMNFQRHLKLTYHLHLHQVHLEGGRRPLRSVELLLPL